MDEFCIVICGSAIAAVLIFYTTARYALKLKIAGFALVFSGNAICTLQFVPQRRICVLGTDVIIASAFIQF
ncbi:MAG: hypothetical protein ACOH2B_14330 [Burkholderiaceae bacterium]